MLIHDVNMTTSSVEILNTLIQVPVKYSARLQVLILHVYSKMHNSAAKLTTCCSNRIPVLDLQNWSWTSTLDGAHQDDITHFMTTTIGLLTKKTARV